MKFVAQLHQAVANKAKMTRGGLWLGEINWLEKIECHRGTVLESLSERPVVINAQVAFKPNELSTHHSPCLGEALWGELPPSLQSCSDLSSHVTVEFFLGIRTLTRRGHH